MGGEGPYISFNEHAVRGVGFRFASSSPDSPDDPDAQLEETYRRAHGFLLDRVKQLVELGWEQRCETKGIPDSDLLASLSYTRVLESHYCSRERHVQLYLPRTAKAWSEPSLVPRWKTMFERSYDLFAPRRRRGSTQDRYADAYLYVDVEPPLRDVFNLLQCLFPEMLTIVRIDDIDDVGEEETTQRFPSPRWIEDYSKELSSILGEERFRELAESSKERGCLSRMLSSYSYDDEYEEDDRDFTACDKECGYCGHCDY